jgi:hypothetical protein
MRLPGFTAEGALEMTREHFRTGARFRQVSSLVRPASCDTDCLEQCYDNAPDCWEIRLSAGACGRALSNYRRQCRHSCCQ